MTGNWLYLKIYTGTHTADRILNDVLYPFWIEVNDKDKAEEWFFIRYSDPDFHLRFRLKSVKGTYQNEYCDTLNAKLAYLKSSNLVWKVEEAVYVPEYDRYGKATMVMAEKIFSADSNAFMRFLNIESELDENARWLYSIASINGLLDDFGYSSVEKKDLLLSLNRTFSNEFGKDSQLAAQLSERYRKYRRHIGEILDESFLPFFEILSIRSEEQRDAVATINEHCDKSLSVERDKLLSSFIHMSMNRIFRNNNRLHEMVIYDLLFRHYKSMIYRKI